MRYPILSGMIVAALAAALSSACGGNGDEERTATPRIEPTATAVANYPSEVQLTDADNGKTVRLARDGSLIVALQSNPSTGFSWYVGESAGPELELAGEPTFVPPGSTSPVVGAPGTQVFTFRTTSTSIPPEGEVATVQLRLEYKREFEPDVPPEKTFDVTVEIR